VNQGTVSPGTDAAGSTVGTLTVGSLQQVAGGRLAIQESASGNDKVVVSGVTPVSFNGAVAVTTLPGYTPPAGASLTVVSAPGASGAPVLGSSLSTTDDLVSGHFGLPAVSGKDVVVSRVATAPGAPGLSIAATVNGLDVTVSAPSSDGGSPVTGYSVTCTPDCGIHPLSAPGLVSLTGLTAGVTYTVSVTATNVVGTGAAVATSASPASPTPVPTPPAPAPPAAAPTGNVVATPARLVVSTSGVFAAVCSYSGGPVKACSVRATGPTGAVLATGVPVSSATGAATLSERLVVTAAGLKAATAAGGVTVTLTATITPVSGAPVTARSSLVVVKKITKVTFTGGVLFGSNSAVLSAPGKAALVKAAKQIAGSKILECDGHTAKTGNPSGEYKLGLQRATVICTFIKVEVKALKLKAVGKYLVKSYGSTRPASKNAALNRRVELIVTN